MNVESKLTARFDIKANRIRFDWPTADGEPPKDIRLEGRRWYRLGWSTISFQQEITLVWYET